MNDVSITTEVMSIKTTPTEKRSRETNIEIGAQSEIDRRTRRRAKHRYENETNKAKIEKASRTSLHEGKSMLKHIKKKCKTVNYVDTETSSGTQTSSRRSSRTTPAQVAQGLYSGLRDAVARRET